MPLNVLLAFGSLVTGAAVCRTSAVAPRAGGGFYFVGGSLCVFHSRRQSVIESIDESISLTGPTAEASTRNPPQIESPKDLVASVAAHPPSLIRTGWTKGRGSSPKGAGAFSVHFCAYKSEPVGDKPPPRAASGPFGIPRGPGAGAPVDKRPGLLGRQSSKI